MLAQSIPTRIVDLGSTAAEIAACQLEDGLITWFPGAHGDPWNHVEAAMALDVAGRHADAERAYVWSREHQRPDGSFFAYYGADGGVEQRHVDTNATAYLATGVLHHLLVTDDRSFAEALFPAVLGAVDFVLAHQLTSGAVAWSVDAAGESSSEALLAASSAVFMSLRAARELAGRLGRDVVRLREPLDRLGTALRAGGGLFAPKQEYAMDWYYPVLSGALSLEAGRRRLDAGRRLFVTDDGVLCQSDHRWVTTAETAECAMALFSVGFRATAHRLLATTADKRRADGSYLTGLVYPERAEFPSGEVTSYSAAAVLLGADLLAGGQATSIVLTGRQGQVGGPGEIG